MATRGGRDGSLEEKFCFDNESTTTVDANERPIELGTHGTTPINVTPTQPFPSSVWS